MCNKAIQIQICLKRPIQVHFTKLIKLYLENLWLQTVAAKNYDALMHNKVYSTQIRKSSHYLIGS